MSDRAKEKKDNTVYKGLWVNNIKLKYKYIYISMYSIYFIRYLNNQIVSSRSQSSATLYVIVFIFNPNQ